MLMLPHATNAIFQVTDRLGIDLAMAIRDDILSPAQLSDLMETCAGCWKTRSCETWLREYRGKRAAGMPEFCASAEAINRLVDAPPAQAQVQARHEG